ncbi:MAG: ComF family protein [Proteobacteria bacterium]|nr:ComF family protein [Pseudomonadota bacterium]MBU1687617.1 ComF family protein [Pseudomonadota bacterium]
MKFSPLFTELFNTLINLIYPPFCLFCEVPLPSNAQLMLCSTCLSLVKIVTEPLCLCCGHPFTKYGGASHLCGTCLSSPPFFDQARALFLYEDPIKTIIHKFKYNDQAAGLKIAPYSMAQCNHLSGLINPDIIIPVPVHKNRLRKRGFNQSVRLAQIFYPTSIHKINTTTLIRAVDSAPQTSLSGMARRTNLKNAFLIRNGDELSAKKIVLVDDVFTTGTTVNECAKLLKKNGAAEVKVLTLARVKD